MLHRSAATDADSLALEGVENGVRVAFPVRWREPGEERKIDSDPIFGGAASQSAGRPGANQ